MILIGASLHNVFQREFTSSNGCQVKVIIPFFNLEERFTKLDGLGDPLVKIAQVVDWEGSPSVLNPAFAKSRKSNTGRKEYDRVLEHRLKTLKLPTFLREYEKVARQSAQEGLDHVQFLSRLVELELINRERRLVERRIKAAKFPTVKSRAIGQVAAGGRPPAAPSYGRNAHCCAPPAQIRTWSLNHPAPTSGA